MSKLEESKYISDVIFAVEDYNWLPLGSKLEDEIPLDSIKQYSELCRALVAVNPLVKNGIAVRTSYIWGKDVELTGPGISENSKIMKDLRNQKYLFSAEAKAENEKTLATDGVFLFLANNGVANPTGIRVPIQQITDVLSNPDNREEIWFYRRTWTNTVINDQGEQTSEDMNVYYPTDYYYLYRSPKTVQPSTINGFEVDYSKTIIDHRVNSQTGWRFGLPDAMSVVFWAKAHKDFLEDQAALVKSYSKIAFKATASQPEGTKAMAAQLATAEQSDAGGIVAMTAGANLQAVGRTAGSVDFDVGQPLAGYVAAGLAVPLSDLLADSSQTNRSGAESLDKSKLAIMKARQDSWKSFFERLFQVWKKNNIQVYFPPIEDDPAYRQMQTLAGAVGMNVIHPEEARDLALQILAMNSDMGLPTEEDLALFKFSGEAEEEGMEGELDKKNKLQSKPGYGDNTNREEVGAHEYDSSDGNDYK